MLKFSSILKSSSYSRQIGSVSRSYRRTLSSEVAKPVENVSEKMLKEAAPAAKEAPSSSSFTQRLTGFLVGCGVGFGISFYLISDELRDSNEQFERALNNLDKRLKMLEK